jgi:hypothetical protein
VKKFLNGTAYDVSEISKNCGTDIGNDLIVVSERQNAHYARSTHAILKRFYQA